MYRLQHTNTSIHCYDFQNFAQNKQNLKSNTWWLLSFTFSYQYDDSFLLLLLLRSLVNYMVDYMGYRFLDFFFKSKRLNCDPIFISPLNLCLLSFKRTGNVNVFLMSFSVFTKTWFHEQMFLVSLITRNDSSK